MHQGYKGALDRLKELPPVFTAALLMASQNLSSKTASQYLWRWTNDGQIFPVGGRSGVYFNELAHPGAKEKYFEIGVQKAMPSVVVAGHSVLMETGVSTQFMNQLYLIHPDNERTYTLERAYVQGRRAVFIRTLFRRGHVLTGVGTIPRLNAGAALADLLLHDACGAPAPDDIYFDDLDERSTKSFHELMKNREKNLNTDSVERLYRQEYQRNRPY